MLFVIFKLVNALRLNMERPVGPPSVWNDECAHFSVLAGAAIDCMGATELGIAQRHSQFRYSVQRK